MSPENRRMSLMRVCDPAHRVKCYVGKHNTYLGVAAMWCVLKKVTITHHSPHIAFSSQGTAHIVA